MVFANSVTETCSPALAAGSAFAPLFCPELVLLIKHTHVRGGFTAHPAVARCSVWSLIIAMFCMEARNAQVVMSLHVDVAPRW